jgi:uncharacterized protein (DUF58 family)
MRLTRRGLAVLLCSLLAIVAGQWAGYPVIRVLGAVGVGAVLGSVLATARGPRVTVTREVYPGRVERGRPALARLRVRSTASWRLRGFLALDRAGRDVRTVAVHALLPGAESTYHYELPTTTRGLMSVGPLTLHRVDPFGLARNKVSAGETKTLWVHPRVYPALARIGGHPRHHHEGSATDETLHGSLDLKEVREYQPGDEVRSIHWKATARTGQLMVRDYADPDQPRLTVLLDTRREPLSEATFEEATEVAASILFAASTAGHRCRLVTTAGADLAAPGGAVASRMFLDELCVVRQRDDKSGLVPLVLTTGSSAGGAIVVVTGARGSAADFAPLLSRYSSVTVIGLGEAQGVAPILSAQVVLGGSAREALQQWTGVLR